MKRCSFAHNYLIYNYSLAACLKKAVKMHSHWSAVLNMQFKTTLRSHITFITFNESFTLVPL